MAFTEQNAVKSSGDRIKILLLPIILCIACLVLEIDNIHLSEKTTILVVLIYIFTLLFYRFKLSDNHTSIFGNYRKRILESNKYSRTAVQSSYLFKKAVLYALIALYNIAAVFPIIYAIKRCK